MSQLVFCCLAMACSALATAALAQQPAPSAARPPATDAAPSSVYHSAWAGYRPFADEKVISWKDANDEVRRIGGWRAYLRESQGAPPPGNAGAAAKDFAQPAPIDAGAAPGHDGHHKPKEQR